MRRLRWKKNPPETGLRAVVAGPRGSKLHDGETKFASVDYSRYHGWYWVAGWGSGVPRYNSAGTPCESEAEAKRQAEEYVRACLAAPEVPRG